MNEQLIKAIVHYKFTSAEKILNKLPPKVSNNLKNVGKIIFESINESSQKIKDHSEGKTEPTELLNKIKIE